MSTFLTPYGIHEIAQILKLIVTTLLQPLSNVPTKYQLHTPYGFRDIAQVTTGHGHYSKIKGHYTPETQTKVSSKYQLPTPYGIRDIAWTRYYRSRLLREGQIKVTWTKTTPQQPLRSVG